MWAQAISAILGAWLMFAPWVLGFNGSGRIVDRIAGPIALTIGLLGIREVTRVARYINVLIGAWVLVTPLAFLFNSWWAIGNNIVIGIALIVLAVLPSPTRKQFAGGWKALVVGAWHDWKEYRAERARRKEQQKKARDQRSSRSASPI